MVNYSTCSTIQYFNLFNYSTCIHSKMLNYSACLTNHFHLQERRCYLEHQFWNRLLYAARQTQRLKPRCLWGSVRSWQWLGTSLARLGKSRPWHRCRRLGNRSWSRRTFRNADLRWRDNTIFQPVQHLLNYIVKKTMEAV